MKYAVLLGLPFTLVACASPQQPREPAPDLERMVDDLAQVEESLVRVENRLGHLESEIAAANAENEFTELAIDSVQWPDSGGFDWRPDDGAETLWCHLGEWRGFGKMLRFTRLADPILYLEAEGHPTIQARIATGGICNGDGSTRFALLRIPSGLEPGVAYRLRPRNENPRYRWSVSGELVVTAR